MVVVMVWMTDKYMYTTFRHWKFPMNKAKSEKKGNFSEGDSDNANVINSENASNIKCSWKLTYEYEWLINASSALRRLNHQPK